MTYALNHTFEVEVAKLGEIIFKCSTKIFMNVDDNNETLKMFITIQNELHY